MLTVVLLAQVGEQQVDGEHAAIVIAMLWTAHSMQCLNNAARADGCAADLIDLVKIVVYDWPS